MSAGQCIEPVDTLWSPDGPKEAVWDPLASIPVDDWDFDETKMQHLIEETVDFAEQILFRYDLKGRSGCHDPDAIDVRGMEVGDDRVDVSNSPRPLALALAAQELWFGMSTSLKDTGISMNTWNLCEVISNVPSSTSGSISKAKVEGFSKLDFVDTPPLRIVMGARKGDRDDHASSSVGKSQMLGARTRSSRTSCKPLMEVANWLQDGYLNCCQSPEPKYIPWAMGGSSSPPLWGEWRNLYLFVKSYKRGSYSRIWGSATNELRNCVRSLDEGSVTQPVLANHLRMKQEYLHITYGDGIAVPRVPLENPMTGEVVEPIYKALGGNSLLQGVENRLVQAKVLCTSTGAMVQLRSSKKIKEHLFGQRSLPEARRYEKFESQVARAKFDGALTGNSSVRRLLDRKANHQDFIRLVGSDDFTEARGGVTYMSQYDCRWLCEGGKGEAFTIDDISYSEDMYLREEVTCMEELRVPNITLIPRFSHRENKAVMTVTREGLWQVSGTMKEWADNVCQQLKGLRSPGRLAGYAQIQPIFFENREWVSDDSLIVDEACRRASTVSSGTLVVVTADKRLCRTVARTTRLDVAMVMPYVYYTVIGDKVTSPDYTMSAVQLLSPTYGSKRPIVETSPVFGDVIVDTGSLKATLVKLDSSEGASLPSEDIWKKKYIDSGTDGIGRRYETYNLLKMKRIREVSRVHVFYGNGTERVQSVMDKPDTGKSLLSRAMCALPRFPKRK